MDGRHSILFVRSLERFTGGNLKVFDYMGHAARAPWLEPLLYLAPGADEDLAERLTPRGVQRVEAIGQADIHFTAGTDWGLLDQAGVDLSARPVVNLIQHVWHAHPGNPRREYLSRPALRICVSPEVAEAIGPLANGPVATIPNGVDVGVFAAGAAESARRVFVGGLKNPDMAQACADVLSRAGVEVDLCAEAAPREVFLRRMRACAVSVLLPFPLEGFYLPALEAMALGSVPVLPDCVGARSFCVDGLNCLVPEYRLEPICSAALRLLGDGAERGRMAKAGRRTAASHTIERERAQALQVFRQALDWRSGA